MEAFLWRTLLCGKFTPSYTSVCLRSTNFLEHVSTFSTDFWTKYNWMLLRTYSITTTMFLYFAVPASIFKQLLRKFVIMFSHQEIRFSRVELSTTYELEIQTATLYILRQFSPFLQHFKHHYTYPLYSLNVYCANNGSKQTFNQLKLRIS